MPDPATSEQNFEIRRSTKAKRVSLRVHPKHRHVELIVPKRASLKYALEFATAHKDWIDKNAFQKRDVIPLTKTQINAHKRQARTQLTALTMEKIALLPPVSRLSPLQGLMQFLNPQTRDPNDIKIRIGDMKTRWGSCHPDGRLSFSWRLILAPPEARDYVVAHEVAHLVHHNHSAKFWALCEELSNDYKQGKKWMKDHGKTLHDYNVNK